MDDVKSKIERTNRALYAKKGGSFSKKRSFLRSRKFNTKEGWSSGKSSGESGKPQNKQKKSFTFKFFVFSVIFFILSFLYLSWTFYGGGNNISVNNVDISVSGPVSIGGAQTLDLYIKVKNNNSADINLVDLEVSYPEGFKYADSTGGALLRDRYELGTISAGQEVEQKVSSVVFGGQGEQKDIILSLDFRTKGSNAIFQKERKYEVTIDSSPLSMAISSPVSITSGNKVSFTVDVSSNSKEKLNNIILTAEYPFGFDFKGSSLKPVYSNNVWSLGSISANETKTIEINGVLAGQDGEDRIFRFNAGDTNVSSNREIKNILASSLREIIIQKKPIGLAFSLDGNTSDKLVITPGRNFRADISWKNNLSSKISDMKIEAKIEGDIVDESKISTNTGFYRSVDNTIIWDSSRNRDFSLVGVGDSGNLSLSFRALDQIFSNKNPEIKLTISASGYTSSDGETFITSSSLDKNIKVSSDISIGGRVTYSVGQLANFGPIPPVVDKQTSYTINLTLSNTLNDLSNVSLSTALPPYVSWGGEVYPSSENIKYNEVGGKIIWDVGNLDSGVGVKSSPREVSFKVILTPSLSQKGNTPELTGDILVEAIDNFTNTKISSSKGALTTRISTDPLYNSNTEKVVE